MLDAALPETGGVNLDNHARQIALLAFRCARHADEKRELACSEALKAYLDINPDNENAADDIVELLVDALRARPHWVN